ncbi:hypothetical protein [uncultured Chryseobacterium sp.]|uniref:hypothetical protein n=1 Tax=uncultured Chryseobacterium sp. TaxID=259322 RepID=UPI0025F176A5|nr:hypothetical protein [uncultured Chryseobacterium sp.]
MSYRFITLEKVEIHPFVQASRQLFRLKQGNFRINGISRKYQVFFAAEFLNGNKKVFIKRKFDDGLWSEDTGAVSPPASVES